MKNPFAGWFKKPEPTTPTFSVDELDPFGYAGQTRLAGFENSVWDGGKFAGGFGQTQIQDVDYWTLRSRSAQLFNTNLYARGVFRRLVTNEINTGLSPESTPDEITLGLPDESLQDWTERVETAFDLWAKTPTVCDFKGESSFGMLQTYARLEALVCGDVLVVLRTNRRTGLPRVQLISGNLVQSPLGNSPKKLRKDHELVHGVEMDPDGRQVAYWVRQKDGSYKRLAKHGERSGRLQAWLVYGTDRRLDDVRGQPILSLVMQSLQDVDKYRDSTQRKALINSFLTMFIKKTQEKPGSLPMTGGAVRRGQIDQQDSSNPGAPRKLNVSQFLPGMVFDELQVGEEPVLHGGQGTDMNFGNFEETIIAAVAWANEIPPEILRLAFSNNYSASQAAINEFKIYLNKVWSQWGETFCAPIYTDWMLSAVLARKIQAQTLLAVWRDGTKQDQFAAWVSADWYGSIKPSTDMLKQVKGSELLVKGGYSTRAREARITTGTKFSKNVARLKRENEQLAEAHRPWLELQAEFVVEDVAPMSQAFSITDTDNEHAESDADLDELLAELGENDRNSA